MFKKKRSSSVASPYSRPTAPSSAASSAAIQAFMASRGNSTTNLSSAAAAAALRSQTTSPTPVGEVQTKRMIKRASSQASNHSTTKRPLSRQSSSGSMRDRTFRESSPGRPSPQPTVDAAPPLPPLPANVSPAAKPNAKAKVEKPVSPLPLRESLEDDRRPSVDRADGKRSSINFSRPMSPPLSPPASPTAVNRPRVSSLSAADKEAIEHTIADAATAPVKKKKKKATQIAEGSHLTAGTAGGKPTGTAVSEQPKKKKKKKVTASPENQSQPTQTQPTRASGVLTKQPSIVREDREAEEREEKNTNGHALAPSDADSRLSPLDTANVARRNSNSPSRSAYFSQQPVQAANGRLHEPLGRSASPGKSAMKRTPSPRGPSPSDAQWNRSGYTPSEASDVPSQASEETRKKKKAVHVSFDDEPIVVGQAAELTNISPVVASPQVERQRKGWFSFGKDKPKQSAIEEEDDYMKPRPALPSFGSIRGRNEPKSESSEEIVHAISSDHGIGGILHDAKESEDPIATGATRADGDGQHTEADESATESTPGSESAASAVAEPIVHSDTTVQPTDTPEKLVTGDEFNVEKDTPLTEPVTQLPEPAQTAPASVPIPEIAIQPSTPGVETETQRDSYIYVPGGFPSSDALQQTDSQAEEPEADKAEVAAAEPTAESAAATSDIASGDESDDSGNSVYSDAASDATDFDGDGFGSINAIVESPMPESKKSKSPDVSLPSSSASPADAKEVPGSTPHASGHILDAQLRSAEELTESKQLPAQDQPSKLKQPIESVESTPTKPPKKKVVKKQPQEAEPAIVPKKPAKAKKASTGQEGNAQKTTPKSVLKSQPDLDAKPTKPAIKSSMRQSSMSPSPHRFRRSMRDSAIQSRVDSEARRPKTPLKTPSDDMKYDTSKIMAQQKRRPLSVASDSPVVGNGGPRVRPNSRPVSMSGLDLPLSSAPPVPKLPGGDDSDSDSSFKRMRARRNTSDGGRVSMRRSMRAAPMHSTAAPARPSSMHSNASTARPTSMRMSMRPSSPEPLPPQQSRKLFGKSKKETDFRATSPLPMPAPRSRRRAAANSDSEDEVALPRTFKSRFVDSSDEEEEAELTPVRGIPRAINEDEAESTDLDGEAESVRSPNASKAKLALIIPNGSATTASKAGEGTALASKTMREPVGQSVSQPSSPKRGGLEKRRSFFGSLGRRKDKNSKVGKLDLESAARRDTPLERTRADRISAPPLPVMGSIPGSPTEPRPSSPRSPKLLKRRTFSNSSQIPKVGAWPPPPPIPDDLPAERPVLSRPQTSDGSPAKRPERPAMGARVVSGTAVLTETELLVKKKKRFGALRKAFGIKDKA